jgi:hypothetical protein
MTASDETFGTAVESACRRLNLTDEAEVIGDYVLVAAANSFDDDGDRKSSVYIVTRTGDQPDYITLGLLEAGHAIVNGHWERNGDSE